MLDVTNWLCILFLWKKNKRLTTSSSTMMSFRKEPGQLMLSCDMLLLLIPSVCLSMNKKGGKKERKKNSETDRGKETLEVCVSWYLRTFELVDEEIKMRFKTTEHNNKKLILERFYLLFSFFIFDWLWLKVVFGETYSLMMITSSLVMFIRVDVMVKLFQWHFYFCGTVFQALTVDDC